MAATEAPTRPRRGSRATTDGQGTPPPEPKKKADTKQPTEYVILYAALGENTWTPQDGVVRASNKDAAINAFVNGKPEGERNGRYKAVSKSAWAGGDDINEEQVVKMNRTPIKD